MRVQSTTSTSSLVLLAGALAGSASALMLRAEDGSLVKANWMVKRGNERGSLLRIPLIVNTDGTYSTKVSMGTPAQDIPFAISFSQSYIAVGSKDGDTSGTSAPFYNPATSSSFVNSTTAAPVTIGSGSGDVQAHFVQETCQVQDFPYKASVAITPGQNNKQLYPVGTTGILGYGTDPGSNAPSDSNLLIGDYLPANFTKAVCGIQLGRAGDSTGGTLTMGGHDPNAWQGDFTTMTVPSLTQSPNRPSWSIQLDKLTAGSGGDTTTEIKGALTSVDPFYPDITISSGDAASFYSKIPGSSAVPSAGDTATSTGTRYTVPCDSKLNFVLTFGGRGFPVDSRDTLIKEGDKCFGAIRGAEGSIYKVGGAFLRSVYMTFDITVTNNNPVFTVGFANLSNAAATPSGSGSGASPSSTPNAAVTVLNKSVFGSGLVAVVALALGLVIAI